MSGAADDEGRTYPLIIVIDELGRCRPEFAIDILEKIRHFFLVDNFCFLLATYLPHIENIFCDAYGTSFDAKKYLEKFYHLHIQIPEKYSKRHRRIDKYVPKSWEDLGILFPDRADGDIIHDEIIDILNDHDASLRTAERVVSDCAIVAASICNNALIIPCIIGGLCCMKRLQPDLFYLARTGDLSWQHARTFLRPRSINSDPLELSMEWWALCTGQDIQEDHKGSMLNLLARRRIHRPKDLLFYMSSYITDLNITG